MGLRFILGRAGTGKTYTCLAEIRRAAIDQPDGPPLLFLVPEQATFQMEQALLQEGLVGSIRASVVSFQRLAWQVTQQSGGLTLPAISQTGKEMVLRALLEKRRPDLQLFGEVADRPGFVQKLASTLSTLRSYNVDAAALREKLAELQASGSATGLLFPKLHDLSIMMQELTDYLSGRFTDPDDYLPALAARLPDSPLVKGAEIWVDGFTGFTPQELTVLKAIMGVARQVHITLCVNPAGIRGTPVPRQPNDLFHPTETTYDQLVALAREIGIPVDPPLVLGNDAQDAPRFARSPELGWLEKYLFSDATRSWTDKTPAISLVEAHGRREEVAQAAKEVVRLVRDAGFRYREICVVARNLEVYGDLVGAVFSEYGIPVFIDRRRGVAHHPLVELVRSALETVISDWAYEPIFRYLKTDIIPLRRDDVDLLENYVLEHGIRSQAWYNQVPWQFRRRYTLEDEGVAPAGQDQLDHINQLRTKAIKHLVRFQRRLQRNPDKPLTVRDASTALFRLLDDLKVSRTIKAWCHEASAAGRLEEAREHEQVWNAILGLLDQMVAVLGEVEMPLVQYLQVLSAGLDSLRLGLIPPGLDQVVVGTVERSRHWGVRAAIVLGATESDFPPVPPEDVIFTDDERDTLLANGLDIGPTSVVRLFQEQFFTYVALTRPSEHLWISYPLADEEGRVLAPSPVIRRLQQIFPALKPMVADELRTISAGERTVAATPAHFAAAMARAFRQHRAGQPLDPVWLDLYEWAATTPAVRNRVQRIMAAVSYEEDFQHRTNTVGPALARALFGEEIATSATELESFAACPFQHFARFGLRLAERARFQVAAPEFGLVYHAALSLFVRELQAQGEDWDSLSPQKAVTLLDEVVNRLAPRLKNEILLSSPQHRYLLRVIRRTLQASLPFLQEHGRGGRFRTRWVELPFGEPSGGLPGLTIATPNGLVQLRGRIDRVDTYDTENGTMVRVVDYKSSPQKLDLDLFYHGLSVQLILYLYVVVENLPALVSGPVLPAGALYLPVYDAVERLPYPLPEAQVKKRRRQKYRAKGVVLADADVIRAMDPSGLGLVPARLKKDGRPGRSSYALSRSQFAHLFGHLVEVVTDAAERVLNGELAAKPYRRHGRAACETCQYRAVCQFDPTVPSETFHTMVPMKRTDVWAKLTRYQEERNG